MSRETHAAPLTVAITSLGAIGSRVAAAILVDPACGTLVAVGGRDRARTRARLDAMGSAAPVVGLGDLAALADVVIECSPIAVFRDSAAPVVERGGLFLPATVSGLLEHPDLIDRARETGARIIVPTGAVMGLDAVRAMARGAISAASLRTVKSPHSLAGAPFLDGKDFDPARVTEATCIFRGTTRAAARAFPANVNVAVALALAGIGPDRTLVEIWADPETRVNAHTITVTSDAARLEMKIEVLPSPDNPRTSLLTPLSILAALDSLTNPLRVGS